MYRFPWLNKNKKETINPIVDDDKCFQFDAKYVNHEKIGKKNTKSIKHWTF